MKSRKVATPNIQALWVTGNADRSTLVRDMKAAGIDVVAVSGCNQARQILDRQPEWRAVVTDVTLPDGNWSTVLHHVLRRGLPAQVLVCASQHNSRLWSEVVERGCHYVLAAAGLGSEIVRVTKKAAIRKRGPASAYGTVPARAATA
jgi:DNA-binding NtrC family response regulator